MCVKQNTHSHEKKYFPFLYCDHYLHQFLIYAKSQLSSSYETFENSFTLTHSHAIEGLIKLECHKSCFFVDRLMG